MYKIRVRLHGVFHLPVQGWKRWRNTLPYTSPYFSASIGAVPPIEHGEVPGFTVLVFYEIPIMGAVVVPTHKGTYAAGNA